MSVFLDRWRDPAARRAWLAVISGILLALGFASGYVEALSGLRYPLLLVAAIVAGADIALRALASARRRQVTIEQLVTIAAVGAIAIGEVWEAAAVTFLFIFGAWLEARTMARTRRALAGLLDLAPETALVIRDGESREIDPADVVVGEMVLVRPGGRVPVDGIVRKGRSVVDEAPITGEPMPAAKEPGDRAYAGTVNQDGVLFLEATGIGADTTLARVIHRVEEAQDAKAPVQRTIDRFARWYTPAIIVLAALAGGVTRDIELALTLLVIGCPGALVIATPVAFIAGIGRAANRGILIKGGEELATVGKVTALALDKTGTLTAGRPELTDIVALQPALVPAGAAMPVVDEGAVLRMAAIAELGSSHPLGRPIIEAARERLGEPLPHPEAGEAVPGQGVWATHGGREIGVGTPKLLRAREIPLPDEALDTMERLRGEGKTAMLVAVDGAAVGVLAVMDRPREDAHRLRAELGRAGVRRVAMLTGDNTVTARHIAGQTGIDEVHAELLPDDKLAWIRARQASGELVAMVGDGINDAPALAAADVGVAMGAAGADIALETADVALMADDLQRIPEAVRISRATVRVIRQNLVIALGTVAALLAGVMLGEVTMAGGMLVHEGSVLLVIANGMRLMRA